jgi:hypothetical protein
VRRADQESIGVSRVREDRVEPPHGKEWLPDPTRSAAVDGLEAVRAFHGAHPQNDSLRHRDSSSVQRILCGAYRTLRTTVKRSGMQPFGGGHDPRE